MNGLIAGNGFDPEWYEQQADVTAGAMLLHRGSAVETADSAFLRDMVRAIKAHDPSLVLRELQVLVELDYENGSSLDVLYRLVEQHVDMPSSTPADVNPLHDILRLIRIPNGQADGRLLALLDPFELYRNASVIEDFGEREIDPDVIRRARRYVIT